jgi:predicted ATPase
MRLNPYFLSLLAAAQACEGALDEALATIEQALTESRTNGHLRQELDLVRTKGEILAQASDLAAAEGCFASALATARATSARMQELLSATSLARLWAAQGRGADARQLLGPVYHAFDEGFGTPDLQDARALLATLEPA